MPDAFKVGDTVRLRSGSPRMTVTKVASEGVSCSWFENGPHGHGGDLQSADFSPAVLEANSPTPPAPAFRPAPGIRARLAR